MAPQKVIRCAVYTRKSTEHNLDLEFNSLDAQRESCEAYIRSQLHEGWRLLADHYDDGGFSGGSLDRPNWGAFSPISGRAGWIRWSYIKSTGSPAP